MKDFSKIAEQMPESVNDLITQLTPEITDNERIRLYPKTETIRLMLQQSLKKNESCQITVTTKQYREKKRIFQDHLQRCAKHEKECR